ncbi:MAG: hypothetical protein EBS93_07295 [Chitinophagia bacterium]|nr:hypothetical protein [Chitinophagia bacterium]
MLPQAATFDYIYLTDIEINMRLEDKGQILPPPVLNKYPQMVSEEIQKWSNIISATHLDLYDRTKVDGADFYLGKKELGHIHLDGWVHLATNKELSQLMLKNKLAEKFPYAQNWVMFSIKLRQAQW